MTSDNGAAQSQTYGYGADFNTRNQFYALGIPTDAPWVRVRSNGVFTKNRPTATFTVDGAVHQTFEWVPAEQRPAWNGYGLEIIGVKVDRLPDPRYPSLRTRGPFWLLTGDDENIIYVEIWLYRVLVGDTHLSIDLCTGHGTWPALRYGGSIQGLHFNRTMASAMRAAKATALVWQLEKAHSGNTPLTDKPSHPWRWFADEYDRIAHDEPELEAQHIIFRLGVPGKTEAAKERKMRRWRANRQREKSQESS